MRDIFVEGGEDGSSSSIDETLCPLILYVVRVVLVLFLSMIVQKSVTPNMAQYAPCMVSLSSKAESSE